MHSATGAVYATRSSLGTRLPFIAAAMIHLGYNASATHIIDEVANLPIAVSICLGIAAGLLLASLALLRWTTLRAPRR
jgi:hypothetical protein